MLQGLATEEVNFLRHPVCPEKSIYPEHLCETNFRPEHVLPAQGGDAGLSSRQLLRSGQRRAEAFGARDGVVSSEGHLIETTGHFPQLARQSVSFKQETLCVRFLRLMQLVERCHFQLQLGYNNAIVRRTGSLRDAKRNPGRGGGLSTTHRRVVRRTGVF